MTTLGGSSARQDIGALRLIFSRWKLLLIISVFSFVVLVAVIRSMTPTYSAETMLLLPSTPRTDLTERTTTPSVPQTDPFLIRSYVDIANSVELCRTVIRELDLTHNAEFAPPSDILHRAAHAIAKSLGLGDAPENVGKSEAEENRVLRLYRKKLLASNDDHSLTLNVAFQAKDPSLAAKIVNAHAAAYIAAQVNYRLQEARTKTAWLNTQLLAAAKDVRSAQVALQLHSVSGNNRGVDAADQAADLKSLQVIATAKQNVYEALMSRYMLLTAEQKYAGSDVRIVSTAVVPTIPKFPNVPLFVAIAAALAVLIGAVLAMTAAYFSKPADLEGLADRNGVRLIGSLRIPNTPGMLTSAGAWQRRRDLFWEQIRTIRHMLGSPDKDAAVIAVTSPNRAAGTSLVAASIARAIASGGTPTLLIDLDFRGPNAHDLLGLVRNEHVGLGEVLNGDATAAAAIIPAGCSGSLFLLSGSRRGSNNVDALSGPKMKQLLQQLRSEFPAIILDTPPCGVVSDALGAMGLADGTVLVATARDANSDELSRAVATLRRCSVSLIGLVLTERGRSTPSAFGALRPLVGDNLSAVEPFPTKVRSLAVTRWSSPRTSTRTPDAANLAERSQAQADA